MMLRRLLCLATLPVLFLSCKQIDSSSSHPFVASPGGGDPDAALEVIYAMDLPTDVISLFDETGSGYKPELFPDLNQVPLMDNPDQMAVLLGALGVDMSYSKLFNQVEDAAELYRQIEFLAERLDVPEDVFAKTRDDLQSFVDQPDSLTELILDIYETTDAHFKSTGNDALASLSLMGGWLEAAYIGVNIYLENNNLEVGDRILQQKYALKSLTGLLANYQESLWVRRCILELERLNRFYEHVEITYPTEDFHIDRSRKRIHATEAQLKYEPQTMEAICATIIQFRRELLP
ncbi:MAG: hypothetical protein R2751_00055 [Bacteroidales bacterium]